MTPALVFLGCAAYGAALWWLARRAAQRRGVALGPTPYAAFALVPPLAWLATLPLDGSARTAALAVLIGAAVCGVFDARTGLIPDDLTAGVALAAGALAASSDTVFASLAAAAGAGGMLLALYLLTRRRGIGLGDVKLAAAIALGLGPARGFVALGAAFVLGGAYGVFALASHRATRGAPIRFGPYLALGAACAPAVTPWLLG